MVRLMKEVSSPSNIWPQFPEISSKEEPNSYLYIDFIRHRQFSETINVTKGDKVYLSVMHVSFFETEQTLHAFVCTFDLCCYKMQNLTLLFSEHQKKKSVGHSPVNPLPFEIPAQVSAGASVSSGTPM